MRIIITGAAGFIGSSVVDEARSHGHQILAFDQLTYAANPDVVESWQHMADVTFVKGDICDESAVSDAFTSFQPDAILHLAAESHVDRSIDGPDAFLRTNIDGTYTLLQAARQHWETQRQPGSFRFHHVSTDEVYGDLRPGDPAFTEATPYQPSSPYSTSKAASDHLVRAWGRTYDLPVLITNCSNNYGPRQHPEKLIPHMIQQALAEQPLPVYGDGQQIRDWLHVDDHARALLTVLEMGELGRTYNIGGDAERSNLEVVTLICQHLDALLSRQHGSYADLITFVTDRPGHDRRYAVDSTRIQEELGWKPQISFEKGLKALCAEALRAVRAEGA